ncbi:MAG TPA: class I SAM-dependent methyltransferase [Pyrinomonadaceae bacterium]|nr:class I SAM-dependent methyltransferase [Pyrinomonadaceae bacterium]
MKSELKQWPEMPQPEELKRYLKGFDFFERHVQGQWEGDLYVETHATRFYETLRFLPELPPNARILELGAIPYYFTILLTRHLGVHPDTLSFFEFERSDLATHVVENPEYGERYEFSYQPLNIETDVFPFKDNSYDLVLCCEVLEHLLINPSHTLYEAHRVLGPGGHLLITTPNALRWDNLFAMIRGANIYDRYHGNGIYGRHNREYSTSEVADLLKANGYEIERLETRSVYRKFLDMFPGRRDNIFALGRAVGEAKAGFPENLYVLMEEYRNVARSSLTMGVDDVGQVGRGWYEVETAEISFRWSQQAAQFYLRNNNATRVVLRARCAHPDVENKPVGVTLTINGNVIGTAKLSHHAWQNLSFDLRAGATILNCEIAISSVWTPSRETSSSDSRQLGIAVHRIWLE